MLSLVLKEISRIGNTLKVKYREMPVKSAWNTLFTREILCLTVNLVGGGCNFTKHFFWKSKTYALVQCLHSVELQRYQVGETSHLLVKHRISGNTKLNFDVGRAGLGNSPVNGQEAQLPGQEAQLPNPMSISFGNPWMPKCTAQLNCLLSRMLGMYPF